MDASDSVYQITLSGSPPKNQRYELKGFGTGMTIKISYSNAMSYGMYDTDGEMIEPNVWDEDIEEPGVVTQSFCGENRFLPDINQLEFYITNDCILEIK